MNKKINKVLKEYLGNPRKDYQYYPISVICFDELEPMKHAWSRYLSTHQVSKRVRSTLVRIDRPMAANSHPTPRIRVVAPLIIAKDFSVWGTYGKDGKSPLTYVYLKDCELDHLLAIISQREHAMAGAVLPPEEVEFLLMVKTLVVEKIRLSSKEELLTGRWEILREVGLLL